MGRELRRFGRSPIEPPVIENMTEGIAALCTHEKRFHWKRESSLAHGLSGVERPPAAVLLGHSGSYRSGKHIPVNFHEESGFYKQPYIEYNPVS